MAKVTLMLRHTIVNTTEYEVELPLEGMDYNQVNDYLDEYVAQLESESVQWELDDDIVDIINYDIYDEDEFR